MFHQFNIQQFYILPTQWNYFFLLISVQTEIFPYRTSTGWFYNVDLNPLQISGHYMYHQFNIQQF